MKKNIVGIILVIILSVWAVKPLFAPGFFPMHDDTQVGRVIAMGRALRLGQFPVRWVLDLGYGYGYPIYNFYGPLPYYFGGALYALGISGLSATKIMFIVGIIGAGISLFVVSKRFLGMAGGLVAAAFYLYAPYHAVQIYVRGAVGEFWFLMFLPLIIIGSVNTNILIIGLGLAGAILSHTILGYVTTILYFLGVLLWIIISNLRKKVQIKHIQSLSLALLLGLGLTAFFWLPAIAEMRFTNVAGQVSATSNYRDHFVCLSQLWNSLWGYGGSAKGCIDGLSFKLGKLHVVLSFVAIALLLIFRRRQNKRMVSLIVLSILVLAASIFFTLPISNFVWNMMPNFAYIQYPWRFLTYTIAVLSLLVGSLLVYLRNRVVRWVLAGVLICAVIVLQQKVFVPQYIYNKSDEVFESDTYLRYDVSKISDEYLPMDVIRPKNVTETPHDTIHGPDTSRAKIETDTDTALRFSIIDDAKQTIEVLRAYFPGWRYRVNGKYIQPKVNNGIPSLPIPEGYSVVEIDFTDTPVRTVGNIVSLITAAVLITIYGRKTQKTIA
jgi:uncharacterized membrane protein